MEVTKQRHVDKGEQDADGRYDFYYEYDISEFRDGRTTLWAMSYTDDEAKATIGSISTRRRGCKSRYLEREDLTLPLLPRVIEHLRSEGKRRIIV